MQNCHPNSEGTIFSRGVAPVNSCATLDRLTKTESRLRTLPWVAAFVGLVIASGALAGAMGSYITANTASAPTAKPVDQLIPWLLNEDRQLRGIPFSEVIVDATGRKVLAFDPKKEVDQRVLKAISAACGETMRRANAPKSAIQQVARINEASSYFEDALRELLNLTGGLSCDFPHTAEGKVQRSGYPDLRIIDLASKRAFYLDAKVIAAGSRDSSFRTFYFEPKVATNKVRDDAVHFIAGFEHQPRDGSGHWTFTRWDVVDLAKFKVKLKAEFQASNQDIYRAEAIVATSAQ